MASSSRLFGVGAGRGVGPSPRCLSEGRALRGKAVSPGALLLVLAIPARTLGSVCRAFWGVIRTAPGPPHESALSPACAPLSDPSRPRWLLRLS